MNAKSRGYQKIESAARAFNFDFQDKIVLDIGSSTGGFTQYALDHGAKKVIAIEKGTRQMTAPLRFDPRVDLHEKTDIFDMGTWASSSERLRSAAARAEAPAARGDGPAGRSPKKNLFRVPNAASVRNGSREDDTCVPDIILADVSFTSLTKVLNYAKLNLARRNTQFFVMLKPQFEARPDQLVHGVVKNERTRREIIKRFEYWLRRHGFIVVKKRDSDLSGKRGNTERFYWLIHTCNMLDISV